MNSDVNREEQLLEAALQIPTPEQRASYLQQACGDDVQLRQRVESMLAARVEAGAFSDKPVAGQETIESRTRDVASSGEQRGQRMGRYKLLEKIGEGGFGDVWMAEQEEPVRRRVALKIIKVGMDTREVVARFEAERQALAMMDHPNIARVFDGGATGSGRPYFVMELVRGARITEYCEAQKLSIPERLELFMQVCQAVQHAHQKGIIHRDLKPSNVLVTAQDDRPVPKVIDFGIAKAMGQPLTDKTVVTRFQQIIGTPAYMSPEQAGLGGLDIDTRSDIYSLGVLLYELLTGRTPFDTKRLVEAGFDAILRVIREEEPPRPSTRLSALGREELTDVAAKRKAAPDKLGRLLRGELDWVVMKSLEKERSRRYGTAADLAADLGRLLRREPVTAAPPSVLYRARQFVARNRVAVGFAAVVTLLGVATTVLAVRSALVEGRQKIAFATQRDIATNQTALARLANDKAQRTLAQLSETLSQLELQKVSQLLDPPGGGQADVGLAVAHLARSIRQNPADFRATYRLLSLLTSRNFARPVSQRKFEGSIVDLAWINNGLIVAVRTAKTPQQPEDYRVSLLDYESGKKMAASILDDAAIGNFGFAPSGQRFWATLAHTGGLRRSQLVVGDIATGRPLGPPVALDGWTGMATFDPTEQRVAVSLRSSLQTQQREQIQIIDLATGRLVGKPIELVGRSYGQILFDADGRLVVPGFSPDRPNRVFQVERSEVVEVASPMRALTSYSYSSVQRVDYISGDSVTLPRIFGGVQVTVPTGGQQCRAAFDTEGARLAVIYSETGIVQMWDVRPTRGLALPVSARAPEDMGYLNRLMEMDALGRRLVRVAGTNVSVSDVRTGGHITEFSAGSTPIDRAHLSPDGELLLLISGGQARLITVRDGNPRGAAFGRPARGGWQVVDGAFNASGTAVLTWSQDARGHLWRIATLEPIGAFGAQNGLSSPGANGVLIKLSPDDRRVVTVGTDQTAHVWDLSNGMPVGQPLKHSDTITSAEFTPDAETLVTASRDGTAQVWNVRSGVARTPPLRHGGPVLKAVVLAEGDRLVTLSEERRLKFWDLASGNLLRTVEAEYFGSAPELRPLANGRAFCLFGGQLRVYDAATGLPLCDPILSNYGSSENGAVSRDGGVLVTYSGSAAEVLALPVITNAAPEWLADLSEALGVRRLTSQGVAESIAPVEAKRTLDQLRNLDGDDAFARWARWFLADGPERPVNPAVNVSQAGYVRLVATSTDSQALQVALELEPDNVPVLEALGREIVGRLLPGGPIFVDERTRESLMISSARQGLDLAMHLHKLAPESVVGWQLNAASQVWLQKTNAALGALERLTASANTPGDWLLRAFVLEFAERIDEADTAYTHAVALERGPAERSGVRNRFSDARVAFLRRHGRNEVANRERLEARGIPARDPGTDQRLLDLGPHYSGSLKKPFDIGIPGDDLAEVPCGVHTLAGVPFDIRGVIDRPAADILVQRPVRRLHFLQGATSLWLGPTNERPVAVFVVHYADGERKELPVIGGRHVRDWFILPQEPVTASEAEVAWVGLNARSRSQDMRLRLFKRTWENPRPDASIVRIDFDKSPYQGLFVLAITADDGHLPASQSEDPLILAEIADATGQAERGLPAVEAALRGNPGSPHILELKARLLAGAQRHADAVAGLTDLLARLDVTKPESTTTRRRLLRLRSVSLKESGRGAEAVSDHLASLGILARDPQAPAELLDLSQFYNASLTNALHTGVSGNDLATLPSGVQTIDGVRFDLRGIVQLAGDSMLKGVFPAAQTNLVVKRTFRRLHLLHATGWAAGAGTKIAALRLHYSNGRQHEFPIVFGEDVRDWDAYTDPTETVTRGRIAWRGRNAADHDIRLFLSTWENPFPGQEVVSLDYVSAASNCAPFLIAVTVEP